jgi:hypothetical protein
LSLQLVLRLFFLIDSIFSDFFICSVDASGINPPAYAQNPITQACLALSFSFQPVYKRLRMNSYG